MTAPTAQVAGATSDEVEGLEKRLTAGARQCARGLCEAEILRNIAKDAIALARRLSQPAPGREPAGPKFANGQNVLRPAFEKWWNESPHTEGFRNDHNYKFHAWMAWRAVHEMAATPPPPSGSRGTK